MPLVPRRVAHFCEHPAQHVLAVEAVVKIDRIKLDAEIAQLGQEHHPPVGALAGQRLQPGESLRFERLAQRIIAVVKRRCGKAIAANTH
ncbi:hypothetical protein D3C87_1776070 [compost metagenome]